MYRTALSGFPFNKKEFEIVSEFFFGTPNTSLIDTERYEVKEKPEWKKKMLTQEIETLGSKLSHYQGQIEHLLSIQSEIKTQKKELEKQLKELDKPAE